MSELIMQTAPLFNVQGDDSDKSIIGGNTTGIFNLNNVKYDWAVNLKEIMYGNFWLPQKVSMEGDKREDPLPEAEEEAFKKTLSFLVFLDSIQVHNIPNLAEFITNTEIKALFPIQDFQELIHTDSYQYIKESLYDNITREQIYYMWRDNPLLLKRNKLIADLYSDFIKTGSFEAYKRAMVANFALEGIYFYNGFQFFYQLAARNKVANVAKMIKYIENDEVTHVNMYANIIRETFDNSEADKKILLDNITQAAEQEIEWGKEIYGDRILGISQESTEGYVKYLTNQRTKLLGLGVVYKGFTKNPYEYLNAEKRENFFETKVTEYSRSEAVDGWDEF